MSPAAIPAAPVSAGATVLFPDLLMGLIGGLALFLFGMDRMSAALKAVAGDRVRRVLARLTRNRLLGVASGAFVTAVIQSSSVTTVFVVGFVSAGLMSLPQSIGVIMGANIGTTVTAQLIAFRVTRYALLLVALGFAVQALAKRERSRQYGMALMGVGLVFFGMAVMSEAMSPLRDSPPFLEWMLRLQNPALGILVGALFTAVVQASAATTGLAIALASQGLLTLPAGIALVLGANIGTCVTASLAALGKTREAVRAALVHVLFNMLGVIVWLPFLGGLTSLVVWLSPASPELAAGARLAAETPRQIANAHTIFNVANTALFLPFASRLARLVQWLVPDRPLEEQERLRLRYLDATFLDTPSLALDRVRLEILHMGEWVERMLGSILPAVFDGPRESLDAVRTLDESVDWLHAEIIEFLGRVSQRQLTESQTREFLDLMEACNSLENIGDVIETNLVTLGHERLDEGVQVSEQTRGVIRGFHAAVTRALQAGLVAATQRNVEAARLAVGMKGEINRLIDSAGLHEARRLVAEEPNRLPAYKIETDVLQNLKRIYYFTKRMARVAVPAQEPELAE